MATGPVFETLPLLGWAFSPEWAVLCLSRLSVNVGVGMTGMNQVEFVFRFLECAQWSPPQPGWHSSSQKPTAVVSD